MAESRTTIDAKVASTILARVSIWRGPRAPKVNPSEPFTPSQGSRSGSISADLQQGEWVGEYVIVRKLGEGGFGAVYEALHPVIGKRAAVKVLHAQYSSDERVTSRFAAEARAVNQIRHKNIVDIFSFGELADQRQYYVMELLEGVPLDAYIQRAARLNLNESLAILSEIAKALHAAHEAGIAHRDLKPENVFLVLDEEGLVRPKILDFGMAKLLSPGALPVHKTRSGTPIGSPRYMSPEQCRGTEVDSRTDVYAFGCMAFHMLSGTPPFDASTALELMMAHVSAPPMPLSSVGPDLGPAVDESLLKMLEKLPENRPQTILDAFESLKRAAAVYDAQCAPVTPLVASPLLREMAQERVQTLPMPIDVTKLQRTPTRSRSEPLRERRAWLWPTASILLAGLVWLVFRQLSPQSADRAVHVMPLSTDVAPNASQTASIEASTSVAAPVPSVSILVNTQPPRAELYLNEKSVGTAPGPLQIATSEATQTLVVKLPHHQTQTITFIPNTDRTLNVVLPPTKVRSSSKVSRDLENPY